VAQANCSAARRSRSLQRRARGAIVALTAASAACALLGGRSASTLRDHQGFAWRSAQTDHFQLYFEPESLAEHHIDALTQRMEESRTRVLALLGERDYSARVTVFAVRSRARMKALIGKEVNGQAIPNRNLVLFVISDSIDASGAHELCHVIAKTSWGNADDWINEGLAVYADDTWQQRPLHAAASYLLAQHQLVPLADLLRRFNHFPELVTYPEAGSFVKFLYEAYGVDTVKQIWSEGAAAIPRIIGKSIDALEREWHDRIAPRRRPNER